MRHRRKRFCTMLRPTLKFNVTHKVFVVLEIKYVDEDCELEAIAD